MNHREDRNRLVPQPRKLTVVKMLHTVVWAFFACCIVLIPVAGAVGQFRLASILVGIVFGECAVLVLNGWRCPLSDIAARYTDDRSPNFDIYLPAWFAQRNKEIFSILFIINILLVLSQYFFHFL